MNTNKQNICAEGEYGDSAMFCGIAVLYSEGSLDMGRKTAGKDRKKSHGVSGDEERKGNYE